MRIARMNSKSEQDQPRTFLETILQHFRTWPNPQISEPFSPVVLSIPFFYLAFSNIRTNVYFVCGQHSHIAYRHFISP